LNNIFTKFKA